MVLLDSQNKEVRPRADIGVVGAQLALANAEAVLLLSPLVAAETGSTGGAETLLVQITGTYVGTITLEGSVDGTNYVTIPIYPVSSMSALATLASAATGMFFAFVGGLTKVRARMSAFTSGVAVVSMCASQSNTSPYSNPAVPLPSALHATATAAVNTAVTLTIPAVAGMFHYLTSLRIERLYSLLGVAAAAGNNVTSTNLPGSSIWTFGQAALIQGTVEVVNDKYCPPRRSTAAGTNTTIVAPAQLQTIWRISADYFIGP